jgi:hypothetical protein
MSALVAHVLSDNLPPINLWNVVPAHRWYGDHHKNRSYKSR